MRRLLATAAAAVLTLAATPAAAQDGGPTTEALFARLVARMGSAPAIRSLTTTYDQNGQPRVVHAELSETGIELFGTPVDTADVDLAFLDALLLLPILARLDGPEAVAALFRRGEDRTHDGRTHHTLLTSAANGVGMMLLVDPASDLLRGAEMTVPVDGTQGRILLLLDDHRDVEGFPVAFSREARIRNALKLFGMSREEIAADLKAVRAELPELAGEERALADRNLALLEETLRTGDMIFRVQVTDVRLNGPRPPGLVRVSGPR